jgi:hypothetical protein
MSKVHLARSGFITKAALPSITRQRGTTTGASDLMLFGAGKTTVSNNTTFIDSSTNAFTVTRNGDTVHSGHNPFSTVSDGSAYFDGTGDSLTVPTSVNLDMGTSNFTLEAWIYPTSYSASTTLICGRQSNAPLRVLQYRLESSGALSFLYTYNSGTLVTNFTTPSAISLNTWSHVAVVRNGTTLTSYVNGVSQATATLPSGASLDSSGTQFCVGDGTGYATQGFFGYISNLRLVIGTAVYTSNFTPSTSALTAITNTQLLLLTDNYSIVNSTPTVLPVTISGNTTISTAQYPTGMTRSIYFDGTGDYLSIPSNAAFSFSTGDFTIEFWMHMTSYGSINQNILDFRGSSGSGTNIAIYIENVGGTGTKQLRLYDGTSDAAVTSNNFPLNTWSHVAVTRSGTSLKFFVNGTQVGSTSTNSTNYSNTAGIYIGAYSGPQAYYFGYISNLRVVKGIAVYTSSFTPSAPLSVNISVPANVTNAIYGVNQLA